MTINYRVGFEGFGLLEGGAQSRPARPDRRAGVGPRQYRRIRRRPGRVTVFGQSAGGGRSRRRSRCPAPGLFQRAIVQSMPGAFTRARSRQTSPRARPRSVAPNELVTTDPPLLAAAVDAVPPASTGMPLAGARCPRRRPVRSRDRRRSVIGDALAGWRDSGTSTCSSVTPGTSSASSPPSPVAPRPDHCRGGGRERAGVRPHPAAYARHFPDPEERFDVVRSDWLLPDAVAQARRGAGGRGRPVPSLRADLAGARHGRRARRLPRPGRPLVFGNHRRPDRPC